jgi:integration host factor subunit beta
MTRSQIVSRLHARYAHLSDEDIEKLVDTIFMSITDALAQRQRIELRGFGAFSVKQRAARTGRNPRTGEEVPVAGKMVPFFKPGKLLREQVNEGVQVRA